MAADDLSALASPDEANFEYQPSVDIFQSEENKAALLNYLSSEVDEVSSDAGRTTRMARNTTIKRQRLARPESETKDFPWKNASNISPPLALQKTNTVVTKILTKILQRTPLFQYNAVAPYKKNAEAFTRFIQMQVDSPYGINLRSKLWTLVYEAVSLGTEFVKVPFTLDKMQFNRLGGEGTQVVSRVVKASPEAIHVPMEDFMTRPNWANIQTAPWVGVRYYKFRHELEALAAKGFYTNVDQIITETGKYDIHKEDAQRLLGVEQTGSSSPTNDIFEIYECNVFWDADGDGFAEDIIVHFEKNTQTLLRAEYNDLGTRDYVRIPHIEIPGSLYALGVGDIMIPLQDEAEAIHNMRNDATQLSILPFIVTTEQSKLGAKQGLFPGKIVKTAVPREDIVVHKFPGVGMESMQSEIYVKSYSDEATGANQGISGGDVGGSNRIGATGTQFLASQSIGYIDAIAGEMENAFAEIAMLFLYQMVRNSEHVDLSMLSDNDQLLVSEILSLNVEDIPSKFKFTANLSKMADSQATKQNEAMQLFQLYMAYGDKISQIAAQMANPQMAQVPRVIESMQTYYVGLTKMFQAILKNFDADSVGDYLPFIQDLELSLEQADTQRTQEVEQNAASTNIGQGANPNQAALQPNPEGSGIPGQPQGGPSGSVQGSGQVPPGTPTIGGPAY